MGVPTSALPDNSLVLVYAYDVAIAIVNDSLECVPPIYKLAVYNLGGDNLVNWAPDQPGSTYWADLRGKEGYNIGAFAPGVVQATSDESTSTSLLNPEFMKTFTLANLQNLKTPWGRQYLAFAQSYGTLWGLT